MVSPPKNMALVIPTLTQEVRAISKQNVSSKFFQDGGVNLSTVVSRKIGSFSPMPGSLRPLVAAVSPRWNSGE